MASTEVSAHYDQEMQLKQDCDASAYGVGAVLSHTYPDGSERTIAYAFKSLSSTEQNYAKLRKKVWLSFLGSRNFIYVRQKFYLGYGSQTIISNLGVKEIFAFHCSLMAPEMGHFHVRLSLRSQVSFYRSAF